MHYAQLISMFIIYVYTLMKRRIKRLTNLSSGSEFRRHKSVRQGKINLLNLLTDIRFIFKCVTGKTLIIEVK